MRVVALLCVVVLSVTSCASGAPDPRATPQVQASLPPSISAPATLGPDGVVPFVDETADPTEFIYLPPPASPPPSPRGPGCTAGQLNGRLAVWHRKSGSSASSGTGGATEPVSPGSLYGSVVVTNTSTSSCTLHGAVAARLLAGGTELNLAYDDSIGDTAARRVTGMAPGGQGSLRLDWDAPFCRRIDGALSVRLTLPHGGGDLVVPITDPKLPTCGRRDAQLGTTGGLHSGAFVFGDVDAVTTLPKTPLSNLRTAIVSHPSTATAGGSVRYLVALSNPTDTPISLAGSVGFSQLISLPGGNSVQPFGDRLRYRLNRRPVTSIPAHASVRYEMLLAVPTVIVAGLSMTINWTLCAPALVGAAAQTHKFTVRIVPAPPS